eukprot:gb/GECG01003794.1/.p1 GENE.gb/GECG01003794.1/~~gb/GECG01003794.1/.p1  ORF type:complete len:114 (+),score=10.92 gb/GECG01003794.1/:1-342(+)
MNPKRPRMQKKATGEEVIIHVSVDTLHHARRIITGVGVAPGPPPALGGIIRGETIPDLPVDRVTSIAQDHDQPAETEAGKGTGDEASRIGVTRLVWKMEGMRLLMKLREGPVL